MLGRVVAPIFLFLASTGNVLVKRTTWFLRYSVDDDLCATVTCAVQR